jgi:hypothetical protein
MRAEQDAIAYPVNCGYPVCKSSPGTISSVQILFIADVNFLWIVLLESALFLKNKECVLEAETFDNLLRLIKFL